MNEICQNVCPCNQCDTEPEECELAKAQQKQISKPVISRKTYGRFAREYCPACVAYLDRSTRYCPECGQKLLHDN